MVNFKTGQNMMDRIIYYILKGRLSIHIRLLLGLACESMQYRARVRVRNTTFFMQSLTAGVGYKNGINLDPLAHCRQLEYICV